MKPYKNSRSDGITVFNYLLLIPLVIIVLGIIIVLWATLQSPHNLKYDILALSILPVFYAIMLFIAPISISFKDKELTVGYLLRKKSVEWESIKYIVHKYGYRSNKYCIIYTENGTEKRIHIPAYKKNLKLLEQYSKLQVIDQYKYRDIKEKEYKSQFKKK